MHDNISDHRQALVVYCHDTDVWWLKFLRPGFRHCFVAVHLGNRWVVIDPMLHYWQMAIPDLSIDYDLKSWFVSQGFIVQETQIQIPKRRFYPPFFLSCVEVVKRIIGLHDCFVLTPAQLFRKIDSLNQEKRLWDH